MIPSDLSKVFYRYKNSSSQIESLSASNLTIIIAYKIPICQSDKKQAKPGGGIGSNQAGKDEDSQLREEDESNGIE